MFRTLTPFPTRRPVAMLALCLGAAIASPALADNPIVQTNYTADPAPMVHEGRVYLYTTHDEDVTVDNFFTMNDWRVYSTVDMVNWTDHGSPLSYKTFSWGKGDAWAGQCIYRNGKFYFYVPMNNCCGTKIGVAVSDSPTGPFKDALGKALISTGSGNIDPTVFIDDDGQAYLYWGNPDLYYVKLNQDMISFSGSPIKVSLTTAGFGKRTNTDRATAYEEGPWFYKRGSLYYIVYPADGTPEKISYTTSSGPTGPWTYGGDIMAKQTGAGASFTNHPGVIDFGGNSYFFYHNAKLPGGGGFKRSVGVEKFSYTAEGKWPTIPMTTDGPPSIKDLDPFVQTEAETIAFSSGLKTEPCSEGGMNVTSISNGDYLKVKSVDFRTGADAFEARVAAAGAGGSLELRLDSVSGTLVGTCAIAGTGGAQTWATKTCTVSGATGKHDLFMKFTGGSGDLFKFNWWKFIPKDPVVDAGATDPKDATVPTDSSARPDTNRTGGAPGTGGSTVGSGGTVSTGGVASGGATGGGGNRSGGATVSTGGAASTGGATMSTGGQIGSSGGLSTGGDTGTSGGASGGCACQTTPTRGHAPLAFLTLLAAALLRRRRFRRK